MNTPNKVSARESCFEPPASLNTAVLFLVFNRTRVTAQVFEAIRQARPPRLYVAADGPRSDRPGEAERCAEVRKIATAVDWPCEVSTLFQENNLGCKIGVSSGINWFFEKEEEGIVLEDDCLPSQSFFWFCEELLKKYRDDTRVWQICGFNPVQRKGEDDYFYSKYGPIWGWASWRRAWAAYDVDMTTWPDVKNKELYTAFCDAPMEIRWRCDLYDRVHAGKINTWDYQWGYAKYLNSGLCITPYTNMIANIGFGEDATHTTQNCAVYESSNCLWPLRHPKYIIRSVKDEIAYFNRFAKPFGWKARIRSLFRV